VAHSPGVLRVLGSPDRTKSCEGESIWLAHT
jgi:hypothetical protein